jgi:hypothetical protein
MLNEKLSVALRCKTENNGKAGKLFEYINQSFDSIRLVGVFYNPEEERKTLSN